MASRLPQLVVEATRRHTATLIFLHGSGDSGAGIKEWLDVLLKRTFSFPHVKIIFPSAPVQFYEAYQVHQPVWFQRKKLDIDAGEDEASIKQMCLKVNEIVTHEVEAGIPPSRIIIGGFSMGGALSLYCAYYAMVEVAGVFALSSFLNNNSIVYRELKERSKNELAPPLPSLFQSHGDADDLIPIAWALESHEKLKKLGVGGCFKKYSGLEHSLNRKWVENLVCWVEERVPDGKEDVK